MGHRWQPSPTVRPRVRVARLPGRGRSR
jgi:hypothetical protein